MSCCGQKRMALVAGQPARAGASRLRPDGVASTRTTSAGITTAWPGDVRLRYLGVGLFTTRSLRTGRPYSCAGSGAPLLVDPQDVESLMRTRLFARA